MDILISGEKLFDYLNRLEVDLKNKILKSNKESIELLMHSQMLEIVTAESVFLKDIHKDKAQLSITHYALPSVSSLVPDLESMCKISEKEESFQGIAKKFKKGMDGKNREEGNIYVPVSEEDWNKELTNRKERELSSNIGFSVCETDDRKLELRLREDTYLQCLDRYSKEFPVLIRAGKMIYHEAFGVLIDEIEESFYVLNTSSVLKGKSIEPLKRIFPDIKKFYEFGRSDYKGAKMPWFFLSRKGDSVDYSKLLASGTKSRFETTENILETLKSALEKQAILKGVRKDDLKQVLAFSWVPFKNAPQILPKEEELYGNESSLSSYFDKGESKIPTKFDLIFTSGGKKVGEIEYVLPHNVNDSIIKGRRYRLTMGGIRLEINGSAILNGNQDYNLKEGLKHAKK